MPREMRENLKIESYCGGNFLETGADKSAGGTASQEGPRSALPDFFLLCLLGLTNLLLRAATSGTQPGPLSPVPSIPN